MKYHIEEAATLTRGIQNFNWQQLGKIRWESKNRYDVVTSTVMSEVLPSTEAIKPLLAQCHKANALAVVMWLRNPYEETLTPVPELTKLTAPQWRTLCRQLESELGEARLELKKLKVDVTKQFAAIEHSLSISTPSVKTRYLGKFQSKSAVYIGSLDETMDNLEQARRIASVLRNWQPGNLTADAS